MTKNKLARYQTFFAIETNIHNNLPYTTMNPLWNLKINKDESSIGGVTCVTDVLWKVPEIEVSMN